MSDLDERLRRDLMALTEQMPTPDLVDGSVRRGQQIRRARRATLAAVAVSIVVAAVVVPLTLAAGGSGSSTAPPTTLTPRPTVAPQPVSTAREQRPFDVAGPPVTIIGGVGVARPACAPDEIRATATLRPSPDGVVGVVNLTTADTCAIHLGAIQPTLLDAAAHPLAVPVIADADATNPASTAGWAPFTSFGFAWDGSWCGTPAAALTVPLKNGSVRAPLSGSQPGCAGSSDSVIIPGALGYAGDPVQAAPPDWRYLTAALQVDPVTSGPELRDLHLTFTNSSDQPVDLQPTPTYIIGVQDKDGDGTQSEGDHLLAPTHASLVVPANGTLRLSLPAESIEDDYRNLRGGQITVTFAMAGVPNATATTKITH